jgi:hypothetical protein
MTQIEDFKDEMAQSVTIYPFSSNDGYKDSYGTGVAYACAVQHKVKNVIKEDGTAAVSVMQIYLDGAVTVAARDKVVYGGATIAVIAIGTDYDIENPSEIYSKVIFS